MTCTIFIFIFVLPIIPMFDIQLGTQNKTECVIYIPQLININELIEELKVLLWNTELVFKGKELVTKMGNNLYIRSCGTEINTPYFKATMSSLIGLIVNKQMFLEVSDEFKEFRDKTLKARLLQLFSEIVDIEEDIRHNFKNKIFG